MRTTTRVAFALLATLGPAMAQGTAPATPAAAPVSTLEAMNGAKLADKGAPGGVSPAILRAEVMLDRLHVSPGVIDGRDGANFHHAVATFAKLNDIDETTFGPKVFDKLLALSGAAVVSNYTLTAEDVAGPYYPDLPKDYALLAKLPTIGYRDPSQKIGAKFHMGEDLLAALNPGADLAKAGTTIIVADTAGPKVEGRVTKVLVDKGKDQVFGYDKAGALLVAYPATIGSAELPSPSGTYKVRGVAYNPIYYYDPKNFLQGDNKGKLKLPPGPNNPVGTVFIALTKPTYGLHGTPDPSKIDKTSSHGCVRMTNWDATELAHAVKRGTVVTFVE